jgi:error-prone DNA polymerase
MPYVELHAHSCFSFREGASTPLELVLQAKRLGYGALALTDHDNLAGAIEFAQAARAWGILPITGAEVTLSSSSAGHPSAARLTNGQVGKETTFHLTLLVETPRGYANLCRLLTQANLRSPRGAPVIDFDSLAANAEGLIALSGCRKGEVPSLVQRGDLREAREAAGRYRDAFGREGFFLELQDNLVYEDRPRIEGLAALGRELGLGVVATNDVHYHVRERHRLHDVLIATRELLTLEEARPHLRPNSEFYLKPPREMERLFVDLPEAIANTGRIGERCTGAALRPEWRTEASPPWGRHPERGEGPGQRERRLFRGPDPSAPPQNDTKAGFVLPDDLSYVFPDYQAPDGRSPDDFLTDVCVKRARQVYGRRFEAMEPRLRQELDLIARGRRSGFFLRLWELLQYAHERDLPVRGRGSSVGSLVCYLLGLSGIDPVKYDLFVGRFLNEARLEEDVPDIDLDFGRGAREEMFRSIFEKYGTAHAAQVCNFIQYRYASAIRDVGRALGLPPGDVDKVAKRMRSRFAGSLTAEMEAMPEFRRRLASPLWREFVRLIEELRGFPRHLSQHSGGVIISTTRIDEQVPVERPAMEGRYICQWDKDSVADAGFIKLDLLAYPTLDQLYRGLRYVYERYGRRIRPEDISLDDPQVYEMIQAGDSIGIVQIQSRAQIQVLLRIKVRRIEDLVIQVALIRPGPIQGGAVNPYIARCLGNEPVTYDHPSLEPVLAETKGVFIFQEQVLQAAMAIAGFSSGQAEQLRRAMSRKRSREAMEALREEFLAGARLQGVDARTAASVYEKILAFAEFGFPKSHAAAMAETAYKVAWLKRYYRAEFYCALLNEQPMGFYSEEVICNDARRHGIEVLGVDVNRSRADCTIEAGPALGSGLGDAIRLGFRYVKGLGEAALQRLEEEAANGPYASLWDFWRRTRLSREAIENLILVGAFAFTGLHERELLWQLGAFYQPLDRQRPLPLVLDAGEVSLREPGHRERVIADLLLTGIAVRGRSMDLVAEHLHEGITPSHVVQTLAAGTPVTVAGLVAVRQAPETAKGFVFHTLEDYFGLVNVITAPVLVPKYRRLIESAPALIVHGHIERQERAVNVIAESFEALPVIAQAERRVHSFG